MFKKNQPIRLKVVSDGTPRNTHITDQETGRELSGVVSLAWEADANADNRLFTLTLTLVGVPVEIDGEWHLEETTTKYTAWSQ